jgi:hypothetical protein
MTIRATASPCEGDESDTFDITALTAPASLIKDEIGEELAIRIGDSTVRLSIEAGSLLAGPVRLDFRLYGQAHLQRRLLALAQFDALLRRGRVPRFYRGKDRKISRPALLLRTLDALAATTGTMSVATALFGEEAVDANWHHASDYMRSQTRRLIIRARHLAAGAYLDLLL